LGPVIVIVDHGDVFRQLFSNNSDRELNPGSFDILHAYLIVCGLFAMQLDQYWSILELNVWSWVSAVIAIGEMWP